MNDQQRDACAGTGEITREWTVWCFACTEWFQCGTENTVKDAVVNFRAHGWRLIDGKWHCNKCRRKAAPTSHPTANPGSRR